MVWLPRPHALPRAGAGVGRSGAKRPSFVGWAANTVRLTPFALSAAKGLMRDQTQRCAQGERVRTLNERYWVGAPWPPTGGERTLRCRTKMVGTARPPYENWLIDPE